jgi:hypothetical protein
MVMIEVVAMNVKTGERFSRWFESPPSALLYKNKLLRSKTAVYIGWYKY